MMTMMMMIIMRMTTMMIMMVMMMIVHLAGFLKTLLQIGSKCWTFCVQHFFCPKTISNVAIIKLRVQPLLFSLLLLSFFSLFPFFSFLSLVSVILELIGHKKPAF